MIKCPYCKSTVDDHCTGRTCSQCGKHIYSEEFLTQLVMSRIRVLRRSGRYNSLLDHIFNNDILEATNVIREVIGQDDVVVETAIIDKILHGPQILSTPTKNDDTRITEIKAPIELVRCAACEHPISPKASACPNCGHPTGIHVCPKCNSINTRVITGTSKAASIFLWGAFAANKVVSKYECKDCGHKF